MEFAIKNNGIYESIPFNEEAVLTQGMSPITLRAKIGDNEYSRCKYIPKDNSVTKLDFPTSVSLKLTSRYPFNYTIPGVEPTYYNKRKIENYLYEITYGNIDYEYAYQYFKPDYLSGCTSIRNGYLFGRNFDWLYNNQVQFVIRTPKSFNRYAVLGVSGIIPGVKQNTVERESIVVGGVEMFKLVPFYLLDGINEKGVFCTHNVVPLDDEDDPTIEIHALKEERQKICIPMLIRFILDNFDTASKAINYIKNYVTVYFTEEMIEAGYQSHLMIGDSYNTYIVEFINGEIKVKNFKYITNFNINNVEFNEDNTIKYPPTTYGVDKYGFGLERWDIISNGYKTSNTIEGMRNLLESVKYSNCYSEPFWYSELVGKDDDEGEKITVDTDPAICTDAKEEMLSLYEDRDRADPKVWITCHSSIYDLRYKTLYITNQEGETEYKFKLS